MGLVRRSEASNRRHRVKRTSRKGSSAFPTSTQARAEDTSRTQGREPEACSAPDSIEASLPEPTPDTDADTTQPYDIDGILSQMSENDRFRELLKDQKSSLCLAKIASGFQDINSRDSLSDTPLHAAVRFKASPAIVESLLRAGADATSSVSHQLSDHKSEEDVDTLNLAVILENEPAIAAILSSSTTVNVDAAWRTYLGSAGRVVDARAWAAWLAAHANTVKLFIERGAPVHEPMNSERYAWDDRTSICDCYSFDEWTLNHGPNEFREWFIYTSGSDRMLYAVATWSLCPATMLESMPSKSPPEAELDELLDDDIRVANDVSQRDLYDILRMLMDKGIIPPYYLEKIAGRLGDGPDGLKLLADMVQKHIEAYSDKSRSEWHDRYFPISIAWREYCDDGDFFDGLHSYFDFSTGRELSAIHKAIIDDSTRGLIDDELARQETDNRELVNAMICRHRFGLHGPELPVKFWEDLAEHIAEM